MGVSENAVSTWATGKSGPEFKHLMRLIQVLGVSPEELLGRRRGVASQSDQLVVELAEMGIAKRIRELSTVAPDFLMALEQVERRAVELTRAR
jgi:transcriptional regulator with XRE-family HTH domain